MEKPQESECKTTESSESHRETNAATTSSSSSSNSCSSSLAFLEQFCPAIETSLRNLGASVRCSICLRSCSSSRSSSRSRSRSRSTNNQQRNNTKKLKLLRTHSEQEEEEEHHPPVWLAECLHYFCKGCLQTAFHQQQLQQQSSSANQKTKNPRNLVCPVCRGATSRRSMREPTPIIMDPPPPPPLNPRCDHHHDAYSEMARAYKLLLRSFGLAPLRYTPELTMTQQNTPLQEEEEPPPPGPLHDHAQQYHYARDALQVSQVFAHYQRHVRTPINAVARTEQDTIVSVNQAVVDDLCCRLVRHKQEQLEPKKTQQQEQQEIIKPQPQDQEVASSQHDDDDDIRINAIAQSQSAVDAAWDDYLNETQQAQMVLQQEQMVQQVPQVQVLPVIVVEHVQQSQPQPPQEEEQDEDKARVDENRNNHENNVQKDYSPISTPPLTTLTTTETATDAVVVAAAAAAVVTHEKAHGVVHHDNNDNINSNVDDLPTLYVSVASSASSSTCCAADASAAPAAADETTERVDRGAGLTLETHALDSTTAAIPENTTPLPLPSSPLPPFSSPSLPILPFFEVGTIVQVAARTGPGMNKPGGIARIVQVHHNATTTPTTTCPTSACSAAIATYAASVATSYDVRYILGGSETRVHERYVHRDTTNSWTQLGSSCSSRHPATVTTSSASEYKSDDSVTATTAVIDTSAKVTASSASATTTTTTTTTKSLKSTNCSRPTTRASSSFIRPALTTTIITGENDRMPPPENETLHNKRKSQRLRDRDPSAVLPPALLADLARQGFDVSGKGTGTGAGAGKTGRMGVMGVVNRSKALACTGKRSTARHRQSSSKNADHSKRPPTSTRTIASAGTTVAGVSSYVNNELPVDAEHSTMQACKKPRAFGSRITNFVQNHQHRKRRGDHVHEECVKKHKADPTDSESYIHGPDDHPPSSPPIPIPEYTSSSGLEIQLQRADALYQHRLTAHQTNGGVWFVVSSSLKDEETRALKQLCRMTRNSKVQIKWVDRLQLDKISMCVVPAIVVAAESIHHNTLSTTIETTIARVRTLKMMQASLAGIPLVSTEWIQYCLEKGTAALPTSSMWIRSLPSSYTARNHPNHHRSSSSSSSSNSATTTRIKGIDWGVAHLAARLFEHPQYQLLANMTIVFCGSMIKQKEADMQLLLQEAGATVVYLTPTSSTVSSSTSPSSSSALLCRSTSSFARGQPHRNSQEEEEEGEDDDDDDDTTHSHLFDSSIKEDDNNSSSNHRSTGIGGGGVVFVCGTRVRFTSMLENQMRRILLAKAASHTERPPLRAYSSWSSSFSSSSSSKSNHDTSGDNGGCSGLSKPRPSIWIVDTPWVFDCISSGRVFSPGTAYAPSTEGGFVQAHNLWSLMMKTTASATTMTA